METRTEIPLTTVAYALGECLLKQRTPSDVARETGWSRPAISNIIHGNRHRRDRAAWYKRLTSRLRRRVAHPVRKLIESDVRSPRVRTKVVSSQAVSKLRVRDHLKVLESQGFRLTSLGNATKRVAGVRTTIHGGKFGGWRISLRSHRFRVKRTTYRGPAEFVSDAVDAFLERRPKQHKVPVMRSVVSRSIRERTTELVVSLIKSIDELATGT